MHLVFLKDNTASHHPVPIPGVLVLHRLIPNKDNNPPFPLPPSDLVYALWPRSDESRMR